MQEYIFIKVENRNVKVKLADLVYVEAMGSYSKLYMTNHKVYTTLISLKQMECTLRPFHVFFRIHRSYIMNIEHLTSFDQQLAYLENQFLPIGEQFKHNLLNRFNILVAESRRSKKENMKGPVMAMN